MDVVEERKDSSVFACARPFVWNDIDVGGRMGVVKMRDGSLWIHSPIELDDATRRAVDALGPVKFVVSPNYEHVKYAKQWKEAYPNATLYGCPGLKAKTAGVIPYDVDLGDVPNRALRSGTASSSANTSTARRHLSSERRFSTKSFSITNPRRRCSSPTWYGRTRHTPSVVSTSRSVPRCGKR
jgi:hypothetical protein